MKKTCVFIIGTNGSGKSSVARCLQRKFGGIAGTSELLTLCNDPRVCFAGKYAPDGSYGGVDSLNNTRSLRGIVAEALKTHDVIFCEGSYLDTFGVNTTTAIMQAERQLIVLLVASPAILGKRLAERSKRKEKQNKVVKTTILNKQRRCINVACKYQQAYCPVMAFPTDKVPSENIADKIIDWLMLSDERL